MNQRIRDIITDLLVAMKRRGNVNDPLAQMEDMAKLLAILAEEQAESAAKMERQTNQPIRLTRIIVILTVGLLAYTAVLCFLTFKLAQ